MPDVPRSSENITVVFLRKRKRKKFNFLFFSGLDITWASTNWWIVFCILKKYPGLARSDDCFFFCSSAWRREVGEMRDFFFFVERKLRIVLSPWFQIRVMSNDFRERRRRPVLVFQSLYLGWFVSGWRFVSVVSEKDHHLPWTSTFSPIHELP